MRRIITILVLVICLIPFSRAFSEEARIEGEISAVGKYIGVDAAGGGEAKFTEYRDLREHGGLYGRARLNYDAEKYFLNFKASDFGYDTQKYKLDGGLWGQFKYDLFYQEIPHNITFDARTPFIGAGSSILTGAANTNVATWDTFDYSYERRQYGGNLKLNLLKPFFFNGSFQREEREGIKPTGMAATSPGGIGLELPEPVDYQTNNLKLEGGYAKNPLFLSLMYFYSDFNNSNTSLNLGGITGLTPAISAPRLLSLPPDNTYNKGAFKGGVKLPFNSKFSTNLGFAKGESDTSLLPNFDGEVETRNYDFILTSSPVRFLDAKVFYKYYKRENKSDRGLQATVGGVDIITADFLDYKTANYGAEVGFRLPARLYLNGGYQYLTTEREFIKVGEAITDPDLVGLILPSNRDRTYFAQLKWSQLEFMDIMVGFERLNRDEFKAPVQTNKMYAYAAQERDTFKTSVDVFPLENLSLGFEYRHRRADYNGTVFGLTKDKRDEIGSNVAYAVGKIAKLYGNVDFGLIKFQPDLARTVDPNDVPWDAKQKDRTFAYGLGSEIYAIPNKLTFVFQHDYLKSNGKVDFTIDPALLIAANGLGGATQDTVDILHSEDYTLYSFKIKAIYSFTKSLAASLGYAYERFSYSDDQLNGYVFVPATTGTNGAFLTGAYRNQSYKANVVFGGLTYKF
jgi:MtrB/PioB family decaheme-associated outer membrane protein